MDAETFTLPEKPRLVRVMVELNDGPATEDGLADIPKSGTPSRELETPLRLVPQPAAESVLGTSSSSKAHSD